MKKTYVLLASALLLGFTACDGARQTNNAETQNDQAQTDTAATAGPTPVGDVMSQGGLRVYAFDDSPKFPDAQLQLNAPAANATVAPGPVQFDYALTNYELTSMTGHENAEHLANSQQGQHIHNIVDNEPYTAHYETSFSKELEEGDHVVLSFLSRSYHESLKHREAYDLRTITVGNPTERMEFDLNAPHLFYSRPKDAYTGPDTERIMLDFYLVNTDLSATGNQVRATINGTEFMLDRWMPYIIEGLPMGETTIQLELVDSDGTLVPGPYNSVTRTITLKPAA